MFGIEQRETRAQRPATEGDTPFVDRQLARSDPRAERDRRHSVLMTCLADERDRQADERIQAAMDEDYYDHLQWRREDAAVLLERGQAPLVFNEARQTIDWIAGTEKAMRKDYKILGVERTDEAGAEVVGQVVKYTDEANLTPWHRSRAFKQAALSGLGWLEEGINPEPGEELIYGGSEDWRNVYRDSRSTKFDLKDARYLFRRKVTDLDYALALLPDSADHLRGVASTDELADDIDNIWYLGERLTGASDLDQGADGLPASWRDRSAFIGHDHADKGRRSSVELLECWYRVPEPVMVFDAGPFDGKVFNRADYAHQQARRDRHPMYAAVKMRMRVMVATRTQALWDGPSPFAHGSFLLVPIWGYRRYRDGQTYGAMRGMRDLQDDTNKRASKAQWLLSANRIVMDEGAVEDIEHTRDEAARPDGIIVKRERKELRFEGHQAEAAGNLEMMSRNVQVMRNVGGVTNENLGHDTNAQSGIAIERKQDQGTRTTSELFDNYLLGMKLAGRLRLSHIKQFMTKARVIRIIGEGKPVEWVPINQPDPETGELLNDLAAITCDFVVAEQDYRENHVRAATAEMFELLGQIATFAPQVVLAVLDLAVEGSEVRNKDEWVQRIRKLNGQRDPAKELTPDEQAAQEKENALAAEAKELQSAMAKAQLAEAQAKVAKLDTEALARRVDSIFAALQAAQIVAMTPNVAPVADEIARGAGFKDQAGEDPDLPMPSAQAGQAGQYPQFMQSMQARPAQAFEPQPAAADPQGLEGIHDGIHTPQAADNLVPA